MAYYKLVASGRSDVIANEIIIERGDPPVTLTVGIASELSDEQFNKAIRAASMIGYKVVEADAPQDENSDSQPVGADVVGQSPQVQSTGTSGATISSAPGFPSTTSQGVS